MKDEVRVGFDIESKELDLSTVVPKSIWQGYMMVPLQFKILFLLAFLYKERSKKIIVFLSTCESVNYFYKLFSGLDWSKFFNDGEGEQILKNIYKLHGSIPHDERKVTFRDFDKATQSVLFATDVASRGLDF